MNKFPRFLAGLLAGQLIFASSVSAATTPSHLAPDNSFVYLELNTVQNHPLKGKLQTILQENLGDSDNQAVLQIISENIDNTTLGFSQSYHQTDGSEIYFLSMFLPEESFNQIINNLSSEDLTKEDLGLGRIIYLSSDDFYFTYKSGNLLASNKKGIISDLLMQNSTSSINQNADFQFLQEKSQADSFFKAFINFQKSSTPETLFSPALSEGFSMAQNNNGISGVITVKTNETPAINPNNWLFQPDLYRRVNPQNLLLFNETFNFAEHTQEAFRVLSTTQDSTDNLNFFLDNFKSSLIESTGLNLDTDLSPLFKNRTAFALHSDLENQYYPAFTLISEVPGQESKAANTLNLLQSNIINSFKESFSQTYDREISYRQELLNFYGDDSSYQPTPLPLKDELEKKVFSTSTVSGNGLTFNQLTIDPNYNQYFYGESYTPDPKAGFSLSSTVTPDGLLIVTSLRDPLKIFSTNGGLDNDQEWRNSFKLEKVLDVSYLNFLNLGNYIQQLTNLLQEDSEEVQPVLDFLAPFKSFLIKSKYENGFYLINLQMNLDFSKVAQLEQLLKTISEWNWLPQTGDYSWEEFTPMLELYFSDVDESAWYAPYVKRVANLGIMTGYNGLFKPEQNITRAEFIKTLMSAYEEAGYYTIAVEPQTYFNDVELGTWYAPYVNKAKVLGIVKGYSDNTFRPAQNITRAEATTILSNLVEEYGPLQETPFFDVKPDDWFFVSVQEAYTRKLVNGKSATSFAPHDLLTRAETAAIVIRYLDNPY